MCPKVAPNVRDHELHVTGDIGFATQQFLAVTGDQNWFNKKTGNFTGCEMVMEIAKFWVHRAEFDPKIMIRHGDQVSGN